MQRRLCGRSFFPDEEGTLSGRCSGSEECSLGKDFHREQGDYELPGFELRKNFGYCSAQEQEEVSEEEIRDALAEMGKFSPKDELNCGACGYNTCREKAIAIIQNKAEVAMCIPYMRAKQESYSIKSLMPCPDFW